MKHYLPIVLALFLLSSVLTGNESVESTEFGGKVIQIRVVSRVQNGAEKINNAYYYPVDEFYYFSKALDKCLNKIKGDYHFVIVRFPEKVDESDLGITLYLNEWSKANSTFINVDFSARYKNGEDVVKIGTYSGSTVLAATSFRHLREKNFEKAVLKAGDKFIEDLQPILDNMFGKEAIIEREGTQS